MTNPLQAPIKSATLLRQKAAPRSGLRQHIGDLGASLAVNAALGVVMILTAVPYFYVLSGSFKPNTEIYSLPIHLLPSSLYLENYQQLLTQFPFIRWFVNSIFVTIARVSLSLFFCSMAGFAFAKYEFLFKGPAFLLVLITMILPFEVLLVPLFTLMARLSWTNNYLGLIVPFAASSFGIFLMRQFAMSVPNELLDAARIDGAAEFSIYRTIALPMMRPGLAVMGIIFFTESWNDFLWPLVVLSKDNMYTLPLGIATMVGPYHISFGTILAGSFLSTVPIVVIFLLLQRHFIAGLTVGALKGS